MIQSILRFICARLAYRKMNRQWRCRNLHNNLLVASYGLVCVTVGKGNIWNYQFEMDNNKKSNHNSRRETVKVLDIGSYDVNGTYRGIFDTSEWQYTGLDMEAGPNVDIVPKDPYHWDSIPDETFDLVISGQAFEHIEYPWVTIKEIERVLKPSGFCILSAPSAGEEHKYPKDCYRYYADGLTALAKWTGLKVCHTSVGGAGNKISGEMEERLE